MRNLDEVHPGYGFSRHKGYGTQLHRQALLNLGTCLEHRLSFTLPIFPQIPP
jgi:ribonuclease HII